jgi:myo-inositol-1(or 4)-monophosphatase
MTQDANANENRRQGREPYVIGRKSYTAVAVNTASKAGEWIKTKVGNFRNLQFKKSPTDLVTEVDKGAEQMIRSLIATHFPEHAFLGEEEGADGLTPEQAQEKEFVWIVDPVDGTVNFVHGYPAFSVSIALAHKGEVIVGVVYDPSRDEMFVAEKGKGAYLHGKRLRVSGDGRLAESMVATGLPAVEEDAVRNLEKMRIVRPSARAIRMAGSATIHLAYVAAGRLSGYWEYGLNVWDMAAGALLVTEAGGKITDLNGEPLTLRTRNILATNGLIHDELLDKVGDK